MHFTTILPAASSLSDIVTTDMVSGVYDQIIGLLPVVIPVVIGFIGIKKGIGYLMGTMKRS